MDAKLTPGPWRYARANPSPTSREHLIAGAVPGYLAEMRDCGSGDPAANARHIVQCVNAHDELEAIARDLLADDADIEVIVERARAALSRASGQKKGESSE